MRIQKMLHKTSNYHEDLSHALQNSKEALAYLKVALEEYQEDNNTEVFLIALRNVAEARGGLTQIAKKTHMNRQALYKTLSPKGNPKLQTLGPILKVLGFNLSIQLAHR
jgi:probable addiction module antidote protein